MAVQLNDCAFFEELSRRTKKSQRAVELLGAISFISTDISPFLEMIRRSYPTYTDHGINHTLRLCERAGKIISPFALKKLSSYELYAFIMSSLFHDIGMAPPRNGKVNAEYQRNNHHVISSRFAGQYLRDHAELICPERLIEIIQFVILCHGLTWDEMKSNPMFERIETIGGEEVRPNVLAVLLRVGDLMDLDYDRTSERFIQYYNKWLDDQSSAANHLRHMRVSHFLYNPDLIEITISCETRDEYEIWSRWLKYLREDIEKANTYEFRGPNIDFHLPVPIFEIERTKNANFELWPLRFEIDDAGRLWEVVSKSIYTGRFDFIRELIQNGIDACLRMIYDDSRATVPNESPRNWLMGNYQPCVVVMYSERNQRLAVIDNGIGMGKDDLGAFLFRVAASGMLRVAGGNRSFPFPSIAVFGIGFISVLTRATKIELITRRRRPKRRKAPFGYRVFLDGNLRDAVVERDQEAMTGTSVILSLEHGFRFSEVRRYLIKEFQCPCVGIRVYNWDDLKSGGAQFQSMVDRLVDLKSEFPSEFGAKAIYYGAFSNDGVSIEAAPPTNPPIEKAIFLSMNELAEVTSIDEIGSEGIRIQVRNAELGIAMIPIYYDDLDAGMEIRAIHSFLVRRGIVVREISFNARATDEMGEYREDINEIMNDVNLYDVGGYDELIEEMDDARGDNECIEDLYDVITRRLRNSQIRDEIEMIICDVINVKRDKIIYETEREYRAAITNTGRKINLLSDYLDIAVAPSDSALHDSDGGNRVLEDALVWYSREEQSVTQDGMVLPLRFSDVLPIGAAVGKMNFMGAGRFRMNVTRHDIDRSPNWLRRWFQNTGLTLLFVVAGEVRDQLRRMGIGYEWKDLWNGEDERADIFDSVIWNKVGNRLSVGASRGGDVN